MELDKFETAMLNDAIIEYWHNNIKNSKNEKLKNKYKCIMQDFKSIQQTNGAFKVNVRK